MKSKVLLATALTNLALFSINALAQENESKDDQEDKEKRIVVIATRSETLDTDLAMSVHSIGEDEMSLDNGQHPAESLNSLAGVHIEQLSNGQGHKTAIRMPVNTSGYYLFLQDNIPLQSAAFFNHNALWWSSFNSGVSRMEVLKGAGTALHGSGAVAATINVLSKPVDFDGDNFLSLTLGEDNYQKVQASTSNSINQQSGYRVSASHLSNGGWRDHTASTRSEINFRHELELSNDSKLTTLFVASDLEQEMASSLSPEQYKAAPTHSGLSDTVLAVDPLRKSKYVRLSTQWDKFDGVNTYSLIPYLRHRTNNYTATWNKNMPAVESQVNTLGLLALANFEHSGKAETTIGLDLELTDGDQYSYQPYDITTTGWGADVYTQGEKYYDDTTRYTGISPYAQYKHQLNDDWDLTLGARYDYASYKFNNHLGIFGDIGHGNLSLNNRKDHFNHLSPKASLNYHFGEDSSLFLRYANSFRLPTASSLYHLKTRDSEEGISRLKPEVSDTYEVGYKTNLKDLTFDFAIYYMDVDQGIVRAYNDNGQRYLVNATRVIHKGIEFASDWQLSDSTKLSFAYSRSKHFFDEYNDFSGNSMMSAPEYVANLRLQYTPTSLPDLTTMLEAQSLGDYWMDDENSEKYNGYSLVHLKAKYQFNQQLAINARIVNAAGKDYVHSGIIRYGRTQLYPGTPRTFYLGVSYQW